MPRRNLILFLAILLLSCQTLFPPSVTTTTPNPPHTQRPPTATTQIFAESEPYEVRIHPEDGLYVGDLVSFEIIAPELENQSNRENEEHTDLYTEIEVQLPTPVTLGPEYFRPFGIGDRLQATLKWVWDTTALEPGEYGLTFRILPEGPEWDQTITLFPQDALPPHALEAEWVTTPTECCLITYLTETAAARDIEEIIKKVDDKTSESLNQMGKDINQDIHIVLMPRVLGHGGFVSGEIYISYLDRNYVGEDLTQVLHHEIIHAIDLGMEGDTLPNFLMEGLAVYQTQGHYKRDPLLPRAATLLDLGWYIPLLELPDDFYFHQHEIGYMEAGALVEFMIAQWGYEAFDAFYRDIRLTGSRDDADAIDEALQTHFGITFAELAEQFLTALHSYPIEPNLRDDVFLTVSLYDTIRRYQQILDPSAYFLTAWLITLSDFQAYDIAADYLRHPSQPENLTIETLLISAHESLVEGQFEEVRNILDAVNAALDRLEKGYPNPFAAYPLSESHNEIVTFLSAAGYETQQISLDANSAQVLVTQTGPNLIPLSIRFNEDAWQLE
jgi:hypothetical protein